MVEDPPSVMNISAKKCYKYPYRSRRQFDFQHRPTLLCRPSPNTSKTRDPNVLFLLLVLQERIDLVSKGSVPVLYGLSSDEDLTTLHYVACTLVRLGTEEQGHARMIQEGAAR